MSLKFTLLPHITEQDLRGIGFISQNSINLFRSPEPKTVGRISPNSSNPELDLIFIGEVDLYAWVYRKMVKIE